MASPYRLQGEGYFYYIRSRPDGRKRIYISRYDYEKFLEYIMQAKEKYKFHLYTYVLMSSHYHLLFETIRPNLSKVMYYINRAYTAFAEKESGNIFTGKQANNANRIIWVNKSRDRKEV